MTAPSMCFSVRAFSVLTLAAAVLHGQTLKPTAQQLRDQLALTSRIAAVESPGALPFRLSATFATFDYLGQPAGEGTLEETWLRPGYADRVITLHGERSDHVAQGGTVRKAADTFTGSFMQRRIVAALLNAVPEGAKLPEGATLDYQPLKVSGGNLDCIVVKAPPLPKPLVSEDGPANAYCSDPGTHVLRIRQERYDFVVVYNKFVRLGEHQVAQSIEISQNGKPRAHLTVTSFAAAPSLTEKDFVVSPNAEDSRLADVEVPGPVIAGAIVKKVQPAFPETAKRNGVSGTVLLDAIVDKDGTVLELDVISSPSPDLTASAMQAVKQWRYKPYLINGAPTEVNTTIRVNYAFGL